MIVIQNFETLNQVTPFQWILKKYYDHQSSKRAALRGVRSFRSAGSLDCTRIPESEVLDLSATSSDAHPRPEDIDRQIARRRGYGTCRASRLSTSNVETVCNSPNFLRLTHNAKIAEDHLSLLCCTSRSVADPDGRFYGNGLGDVCHRSDPRELIGLPRFQSCPCGSYLFRRETQSPILECPRRQLPDQHSRGIDLLSVLHHRLDARPT